MDENRDWSRIQREIVTGKKSMDGNRREQAGELVDGNLVD